MEQKIVNMRGEPLRRDEREELAYALSRITNDLADASKLPPALLEECERELLLITNLTKAIRGKVWLYNRTKPSVESVQYTHGGDDAA